MGGGRRDGGRLLRVARSIRRIGCRDSCCSLVLNDFVVVSVYEMYFTTLLLLVILCVYDYDVLGGSCRIV